VAGLSRPPAHDVVQHEVGRVAMKYMNFCFYALLLQTEDTSSNVFMYFRCVHKIGKKRLLT